jgi:6-pyruvoyltetrahydropterin/6-carboxytetrahydropterin synthase
MFTDRIEINFEAGHRLLYYKGKCEAPHGHTFRAEIMISSGKIDELGFVVDFVQLKEKIGNWINKNWDHAFLINDQDQELLQAFSSLTDKKIFVFEKENPSAENLARYLYRQIKGMYGTLISRTRIWESPTDYAEYWEQEP